MAGGPLMSLEEDEEEKAAQEHIEEIRKKLREAQKVDLAFLLDATGSMGPLIKAVKEKIVEIAEGLKGAFPEDGELRFACAFYRDYDADDELDNAGQPRYQRSGICCHFTRDVKVFQKHLGALEAWGGGDCPEDVFSGLGRLLELDWAAPATRLVYHIADDPCHGRRFHDSQYAEKNPDRAWERFQSIGATQEDDPEGRKIEDILMSLAVTAKISNYTFLHIHREKGQRPRTAKMLEEFRKANDNNPSSMGINEHTVEMPAHARGPKSVEGMNSLRDRLSELVRNDVKKKVQSTMDDLVNKPSEDVKPSTVYGEVPVDDRIPADWATLAIREVLLHRCTRYETLDEILTQVEQGAPLGFRANANGPIQVRIAEHPFTPACATRWPFYAKIQVVSGGSWDPTATKLVVVKKFKSVDNRFLKDYVNPYKNPYLEVMETYAIASQFAAQFIVEIKNEPALAGAKMLYIDAALSTLKLSSSMECFTVETLYSNAQWVKVHEQPEYHEILQAFSHWTHVNSEECLMVIVHTLILEGGTLDKAPRAILCDPTIHSIKYPRRFKRTNKGEMGIQYFYRNHKCNEYCKVLGLEASK